jgi:hypothetical protein
VRAAASVDGAEDAPRATCGAGGVEPPHQRIRVRRAAALARVRLRVQPKQLIERAVRDDLHGALGLADRAPDVLLEVALDAIEVRQVLDPIRVADGRLEPGPVERQPVRQAG